MERPFSIAGVSFFDEADRLVTGLHWAKELEELILRRLYAVPGGVNNLSYNLGQRLQERDLFPHINHRLPRIMDRVLPYLFFQCIATKRVGEFNERFELSVDNDLVISCDRFGILEHDWRRRRRRRRGRWGRCRSDWSRAANPSSLFLDICDILNPGCNGF